MALTILVRTTNPVLISALKARLSGAGIEHFELDEHMSMTEGSLGFLPRRLMVAQDDLAAAKAVLAELAVDDE
ncbi:MAG: DUF2007 domain-containing protein [Alphaproteobacteria bacterium]